MADYLIVSGDPAHSATRGASASLAAVAEEQGYERTDLGPGAWLAVTGPHPPACVRLGAWLLIGDVFLRHSASVATVRADDPVGEERQIFSRVWGRYIGVRMTEAGEVGAILRDPSGALECIAWRQDGLTLIASTAPEWLVRRLRPPWRINLPRLAQAMRDPLLSTGPLLIDGPTAIDPGCVQPLPLECAPLPAWRPVEFARRSLEAPADPEAAAALLQSAVDEAVAGLAGGVESMAVEISGGLDSSIVAASVARRGIDRIPLWLNAYGAEPEADERVYVEALGRTLGINPVSVPHASGPLTEVWLERISQDIRPGLNALDPHHDLDWVRRLTAAGAGAVMTGKGGDSILLHAAGPDVFTDHWRAGWMSALCAPDTPRLAAFNECSVWSLVAHALRCRRNPRPTLDEALLTPIRQAAPIHPWFVGSEAFGPAKAFQIAGVVDSVSRHGRSLLTEAIDVRHPLCAQPVIETCLALPTPILALGGRGRGLARHAFRNRLPALITDRRSKGDMTRIYGRMILDNLHVLRPWLLDGRLAQEGILDRVATEAALEPANLMWRGRYSAIIRAAAFEGWLRVWSNRLPYGWLGSTAASSSCARGTTC
jgi:asparagine synthase (glutamine-hydrolysing)